MTASLSSPITPATTARSPRFGALSRTWNRMLALGVVALACGVIGLLVLFALTLVDVWYVGILLLLVAIAQVAVIPGCRGWNGIYWQSAIAAVYALGGVVILADPLLASAYTGAAVAGLLLGAGFARAAIARQLRARPGWMLVMLTALVALLLGVIAAVQWPLANPFDVALYLSLEMVLLGTSCLVIAAAARRESIK